MPTFQSQLSNMHGVGNFNLDMANLNPSLGSSLNPMNYNARGVGVPGGFSGSGMGGNGGQFPQDMGGLQQPPVNGASHLMYQNNRYGIRII